jgi:hypothetical protein
VARACFYCGAAATADDHAIAPWVPALVGLGDARIEHMTAAESPPSEAGGPAHQILPPIPSRAVLGDTQAITPLRKAMDEIVRERTELALGEYSARVLCRHCAEWASDLDSDAIPLLRPMVESEARAYSHEEHRLLAAWGARAAYAILAVERKSQGVPKPHRRTLRQRGEPHPDVYVGYGRYGANHVGVLAARLFVRLGEDGDAGDVEAYSVLAVFGHMAVKVFGVHRRSDEVRARSPQGQMIQVWPPPDEGLLSWPPLWSLSEPTLELVFNHEPFYRPYRYDGVQYLGPGVKAPVKKRRTEGPGPRR